MDRLIVQSLRKKFTCNIGMMGANNEPCFGVRPVVYPTCSVHDVRGRAGGKNAHPKMVGDGGFGYYVVNFLFTPA